MTSPSHSTATESDAGARPDASAHHASTAPSEKQDAGRNGAQEGISVAKEPGFWRYLGEYIVDLCKSPFRNRLERKRVREYNQAYIDSLMGSGKVRVLELLRAGKKLSPRVQSLNKQNKQEGKTGDAAGEENEHATDNEKPRNNVSSEGLSSVEDKGKKTQSKGKGSTLDDISSYVVCIEADYSVSCLTLRPKNSPELDDRQKHISGLASQLNALPIDALTEPQILAFKRMVGQVFVCALENQISEGDSMHKEALRYYNKRSVETFRFRQIRWAVFLYALVAAAFIYAISACDELRSEVENYLLCVCGEVCCAVETVPPVTLMIVASLAGSFFSIVKNAGKRELDVECRPRLVFWDCLCRVIVAVIMGWLTWAVLQSQFVPTAFKGVENSYYSFIVVAFIAGLFDSYIPSLICKAIPTNDACR